MTLPPEAGAEAEAAIPEAVLAGAGPTEGRSLGQIAWMRLKRDKVALGGGIFLIFLILVAIFAPLIVKYLGSPPNEFHQELIDTAGGTLEPIGRFGRAAVVADAVAARLADASLAGPLPCRLPRLNT